MTERSARAGHGPRPLSIVPRNWWSSDFRVLVGDHAIAEINRSWRRERATFSVDGGHYDVRRTSVRRGTFTLERRGEVLASARKRSVFRRTFDVEVGEARYELAADSWGRRSFRLFRDGIEVGSMRPVSIGRRAATAHFPDALSRPVQLFIVFLVLVLWKRSDAAAAGA